MSDESVSQRALDENLRARAWYDEHHAYYASLIDDTPPTNRADALRRFAARAPANGVVLELGSGTGRDADFVESLGVQVRRTDVTQGFIDLQRARGHVVERLDVLTDELGGPHDGVFAMCVMLHVAAEATDAVLRKAARASRPGGAFLVSVRAVGDAHATAWDRDELVARLDAVGFDVVWEARDFDGDLWLVFLAIARA